MLLFLFERITKEVSVMDLQRENENLLRMRIKEIECAEKEEPEHVKEEPEHVKEEEEEEPKRRQNVDISDELENLKRSIKINKQEIERLIERINRHEDRWNTAMRGFSDIERASWTEAYPGL